MVKKELQLALAKAIKTGISNYQIAIQKNDQKEQTGLAKLEKTLGGNDPALSGAGTDLAATSATSEVPNLARAEVRDTKDKMDTLFGADPKVLHPSDKKPVRKPIKKGVLPEGGGPGVPGGVSDMSNNLDAGFGKGETKIIPADKFKPGYTRVKGVLQSGYERGTAPSKETQEWVRGSEPAIDAIVNSTGWYKAHKKQQARAASKNKVAESRAQEVEKAEIDEDLGPSCPACGGGALHLLGILGARAHSLCQDCGAMSSHLVEENTEAKETAEPTVTKGEACSIKKEETNPSKEAPMTATVRAEKVKGAKDGTESPKVVDAPGSGGYIVKGGVTKAEVGGTLRSKGVAQMLINGTSQGGVQREKQIKTGHGWSFPSSPQKLSVESKYGTPKLHGGVQAQIVASKKPLIPMVNQSGPVAKAEDKPGNPTDVRGLPGYSKKPVNKAAIPADKFKPGYTRVKGVLQSGYERGTAPSKETQEWVRGSEPATDAIVNSTGWYKEHKKQQARAASKNKVAESRAQEVEKAEPTMAKPVTRSPGSAPAAKTPAQPSKPAINKVPKL